MFLLPLKKKGLEQILSCDKRVKRERERERKRERERERERE